ncbi:Tautomerase [Penicillium cf. griseofulvum]|uniref:Tautomerase n=1 Tax=Penicillium cf. griseofulvum TaxID=2972120 RepID=A0A9W9MTX2_9EURO|nr:Tautomerase [Penicillium cf. griseofulvum]KAJ5445826.1 Tautomerase [Penicillium cf. griseofulvum]KAJ5447547.1 Tautomerase [Penicillium cf. griseofulvum]
MPAWYIKHSPNTITAPEKEQLAKSITRLYVSYGLPAFYVQVRFTEDIPGTAFVGGEPHPNFAAVTIYHVARAFESDESKQRFLADVDAILNPVFEPKEMDWEYWVTEVSRDLWKINGLVPPQTGSEEEKKWTELNKAIKL